MLNILVEVFFGIFIIEQHVQIVVGREDFLERAYKLNEHTDEFVASRFALVSQTVLDFGHEIRFKQRFLAFFQLESGRLLEKQLYAVRGRFFDCQVFHLS